MTNSSIRAVSYADILYAANFPTLLASYAEECSIPEIGEPNPQADVYELLEGSGAARFLGAYDGELLVGFAAVLCTVLPHYGEKVATVESIYVSPGYRGDLGKPLLQAIEDHGKAERCVAVIYSAPAQSRFAQFLALEPNYRRTNSVFCRRLQ